MTEATMTDAEAVEAAIRGLEVTWLGKHDRALVANARAALARMQVAQQWQPIETAPKDGTEMLWLGQWLPFDILPGGEAAYGLARWSSVMSDHTGYRWFVNGSKPERMNVTWTHWMPLPAALEPRP